MYALKMKRWKKAVLALGIVLAISLFLLASELGFLFKTTKVDIGVSYSNRYHELYGKKGLTKEERDYLRAEERRVQDEALEIYRSRINEENQEQKE